MSYRAIITRWQRVRLNIRKVLKSTECLHWPFPGLERVPPFTATVWHILEFTWAWVGIEEFCSSVDTRSPNSLWATIGYCPIGGRMRKILRSPVLNGTSEVSKQVCFECVCFFFLFRNRPLLNTLRSDYLTNISALRTDSLTTTKFRQRPTRSLTDNVYSREIPKSSLSESDFWAFYSANKISTELVHLMCRSKCGPNRTSTFEKTILCS